VERRERVAKGGAAVSQERRHDEDRQEPSEFCTNSGLAARVASPSSNAFLQSVGELLGGSPAGTMVHAGIKAAYDEDIAQLARIAGVAIAARSETPGVCAETQAHPALMVTDVATYRDNPRLAGEIYGPATLAVRCASRPEMLQLARSLRGQLTATIHATPRIRSGISG
jgi:NADP-dependent aldehyde dehydrogenase